VKLRSWSAKSATVLFISPLVKQFLLSQGQVHGMRAAIPHLSKLKWIWQPISKPQGLKEHKWRHVRSVHHIKQMARGRHFVKSGF